MPTTRVRPHTRNGRPVRGYTQNRSVGDRIGAILRGDEQGSVKKAALMATGVGVALTAWYALSFALTAAESAIVVVSAAISLVGGTAYYRHSRRRHPTKYRSVTLSPRARLHHAKARIRKHRPMNRYRRYRDGLRKRHPIWAGGYDRWLGIYTVREKSGSGSTAQIRETTFRGVKARDEYLTSLTRSNERESSRRKKAKANGVQRRDKPIWQPSVEQKFR